MSTLNTFHKPNARRKRAERRAHAKDYMARITEAERSRPRKFGVYVRYADGHIERELAS